VLQKIKDANPSHPGFSHCLNYFGWFRARSLPGPHSCIVTEPLTSTLEDLKPNESSGRFPLHIAKRIIVQLLRALDYLHREVGFLHGEIKSSNIMARIPASVNLQTNPYLANNPAKFHGPPLVHRSLIRPVYFCASQPISYLDLGGSLEDINICLIDFGKSTPIGSPDRVYHPPPNANIAPEMILGYPWSTPIDIWVVGLLFWELVSNYLLFGQEEETYSSLLHLQHMAEVSGPFPPRLLDACDPSKVAQDFNEDGTTRPTREAFSPIILEDWVRKGSPSLAEEDVQGLAAFLRRSFTLDPEARPTAEELLKDEWLLKR